ncbi:hypothetical protein [Halarcobacter anaerophilus]|uniref:Uncharacterized protein n=1 Tax=Halarcobacter anaerophilus TaxID=877500 RepID=A0A4Q0Y0C8_9BACT|nr:hypothetical protein [Halarcobacter anaerophilus]QDF29923.1 putative membrane protein [Halarcobacter anaerophilus]RXJ62885.1 hypothetical protein CRV06_08605 [Halarcobacter anaerophilus]
MYKNRIQFLPFFLKKNEEFKEKDLSKITFFNFDKIFQKDKKKKSMFHLLSSSFWLSYIFIMRYLPAIFLLLFTSYLQLFWKFTDVDYFAGAIAIILAFLFLLFFSKLNKSKQNLVLLIALLLSVPAYQLDIRYHIFDISRFFSSLFINFSFFYLLFWLIKDMMIDTNFMRYYRIIGNKSGFFIFKPRTIPLKPVKKLFVLIIFLFFTILSYQYLMIGIKVVENKNQALIILKGLSDGEK